MTRLALLLLSASAALFSAEELEIVNVPVTAGRHGRALADSQVETLCTPVTEHCPCDVVLWLFKRCSDFVAHVRSFEGNSTSLVANASVAYSKSCLHSELACSIGDSSNGDQFVHFGVTFQPCHREATIETAYSLEYNNMRAVNATVARVKEGTPGMILADVLSIDNEQEWKSVSVYFKDVLVKMGVADYRKSFHVKFEVSKINDDGSQELETPIWRQVSTRDELSHCGACSGGIGCMGSGTSSIILMSCFVVLVTMVITMVMSTKTLPPVAA
ncbi:hypothetical protein DIPPA_35374 [Diplonema papillatum]|nr:hypothetical protein DIPPA_35374 [Diplonema papillatum]